MNTFGELQITVNSQTAGSLLTDLPTDIPLWVIVDVYGSTQSVQFVQEGKCSHSVEKRKFYSHLKKKIRETILQCK